MSKPSHPLVQPSLSLWLAAHAAAIEALVLDVDGVLIRGREALPGAADFLAGLRGRQVPFMLLTNDGSRSHQQRSEHLARRQLQIAPDEIVTCSDGLCELVAERLLDGQLFFIMGELGNPCYAEAAGLLATRRLEDLPACAGVIVGETHYDWESTINAVLNYFVAHPGGLLIVPNPDAYYPTDGGLIHIGAGGVARFLQQVLEIQGTAVSPIYLGKPFQPIFAHAHALLERRAGHPIPRERVLMLGDSLTSDIQGAGAFGYRTGLMLTGQTHLEMLPRAPRQPDHVFLKL